VRRIAASRFTSGSMSLGHVALEIDKGDFQQSWIVCTAWASR
jgi:hypothetical protein